VDCLECERLNEEEAEAAIDLVEADQPVAPEETPADRLVASRRKLAAEARWKSARERLAGHQPTYRRR
jgi:hypothetical protein